MKFYFQPSFWMTKHIKEKKNNIPFVLFPNLIQNSNSHFDFGNYMFKGNLSHLMFLQDGHMEHKCQENLSAIITYVQVNRALTDKRNYFIVMTLSNHRKITHNSEDTWPILLWMAYTFF